PGEPAALPGPQRRAGGGWQLDGAPPAHRRPGLGAGLPARPGCGPAGRPERAAATGPGSAGRGQPRGAHRARATPAVAGLTMTGLTIRPGTGTRYDLVSLGEVMLRLDPGEGRIRNSRSFTAWEGGGEYNVARGLRRCFGLRTAIVTALADNDIGWLVEDLILQGGVDTSLVRFVPYDGVGRTVRNGLNFTERGFGGRGARGVSHRA